MTRDCSSDVVRIIALDHYYVLELSQRSCFVISTHVAAFPLLMKV